MNDADKILVKAFADLAIDVDLVEMLESQIRVLERQLKETNNELCDPDKEKLIIRIANLERFTAINAWLTKEMADHFIVLEKQNKQLKKQTDEFKKLFRELLDQRGDERGNGR